MADLTDLKVALDHGVQRCSPRSYLYPGKCRGGICFNVWMECFVEERSNHLFLYEKPFANDLAYKVS